MARDKLSFREKLLRHHLTKIYRIALGIALVIAIFIVVRIQIENHVYTEYIVKKMYEPVGSSDSTILDYNGNILCYSKDGISAYDTKGEQLWNQTYEMQEPIVVTEGEYVAATDYKGNQVYIMNAAGTCGTISTTHIILDINISERGIVSVILDDDKTTWLNLFSEEGTEIVSVKTSMDQTGYPLQATMSADNQKFGVSYLKAAGTTAGTSVAFYNFGDVGQNKTDKMVSGFDYNTVVPFLHYMNNDVAMGVGENHIYVYGGKQIPELKSEKEVASGIKAVYHDSSYLALVYRNEDSEEKYRLEVYNLSAELVLTKNFDLEYDDIILSEGNIILYNEADVMIWNMKGLEKYRGDLGGGIRKIIPTGAKNKLVVVRKESLDTIKLK